MAKLYGGFLNIRTINNTRIVITVIQGVDKLCRALLSVLSNVCIESNIYPMVSLKEKRYGQEESSKEDRQEEDHEEEDRQEEEDAKEEKDRQEEEVM